MLYIDFFVFFFRVKRRPHNVEVTFSHDAPAFFDEHYPITINVANLDDRDLDIVVDVLLQPSVDESRKSPFKYRLVEIVA